MVDPDVVLRKVQAIDHHVGRLRAKLPLDPATLAADESLRNDVCFDAIQAIQGCVDLAVHACSYDSLGVPEGPASAFILLAHAGVIERSLAQRLALAAGLRNLIVHQYVDVDTVRLIDALSRGLADLDAFARAMLARVHRG